MLRLGEGARRSPWGLIRASIWTPDDAQNRWVGWRYGVFPNLVGSRQRSEHLSSSQHCVLGGACSPEVVFTVAEQVQVWFPVVAGAG